MSLGEKHKLRGQCGKGLKQSEIQVELLYRVKFMPLKCQ